MLRFASGTHGIYFQDWSPRGIVRAVNGAGFAAVQMASVAGKGDRINHGISTQFYRSLTVAALIGVHGAPLLCRTLRLALPSAGLSAGASAACLAATGIAGGPWRARKPRPPFRRATPSAA